MIRNNIRLKISIVALLLLVNAILVAQQDDFKKRKKEQSLFDLSLEELMHVPVSVSSKTDEIVKNSPSSITVFTQKEIELLGVTNLYELLNYVPGFQVERGVSTTEKSVVHMRGYAGSNPYILVQIDGVPINEASIGNTVTYNRYLNLGFVKQVEVIRGAGGSIYGNNAVFGIVNIITAQNKNKASLALGSENRVRLIGQYSSPQKNKIKVNLEVEHYKDNGQLYSWSPFLETNDPKRYTKYKAQVAYDNVRLDVNYSREFSNDFLNFGHIANGINTNQTSSLQTSIQYKKEIGQKLTLKYGLSFSRWLWDVQGIISPKSKANTYDLIAGPHSKSSRYQSILDVDWQITPNDQIIGGMSYSVYGIDYAGAYTNHIDDDFTAILHYDNYYKGQVLQVKNIQSFSNLVQFIKNKAMYCQYRKDLGENIIVYAGARLDRFSSDHRAFSPKLSFIYHTPFNSTLKLIYAKAFRAPVHNELFSDDPTSRGDENLLPERINTYEAIYQQHFKPIEVNVSLFQNHIKNAIETNYINGIGLFQNTNELHSSGVEISSRLKIGNRILLRLSQTMIYSKATENAFDKFATANFLYTSDKIGWSLSFIYRKKRDVLHEQPTYLLANCQFQYQILPNINCYVKTVNLLNTKYATYSKNMKFNQTMMPNRGREFEIGVRIDVNTNNTR